jgi:hypothetical protein
MQNIPNDGQRRDPLALERKSVIDAASNHFCSACGGQPCYLLTSAALAVFYEVFTHNEDHISIDRYEQALAGIHDCLIRHYELVEDIRTDNHYPKKTEGTVNTLEDFEVIMRELQTKLHLETRNGAP